MGSHVSRNYNVATNTTGPLLVALCGDTYSATDPDTPGWLSSLGYRKPGVRSTRKVPVCTGTDAVP